MADPICRWRNTSVKQILEFNSLFPLAQSKKNAARKLVEERWNILGGESFFTTPYQLAAQMGMYYENDEYFFPKFSKLISVEEAKKYMSHWGKRYYAPNPYTKSLQQTKKPVILNNFLVNWCLEHPASKLNDALAEMFKEPIGNTDILVNMLNSFSEVKIEQGILTLKPDAPKSKYEQVVLDVDVNDKKFFFDFVSDGWADSKIMSNRALVQEKRLATFVFKVFKQLETFDGMKSLSPYASESNGNNDDGAVIIKFKNENTTLTGCLIETTQENVDKRNTVTSTTRWFSEPLSYCNRIVYLSNQWNGAGNYQLTFEDLKYFITLCYGGLYSIEKEDGGYVMYTCTSKKKLSGQPLQQIFYGAPGTGKSNTVKQVTDGQPKENVFRTTFHPDSDYSTFVGCYKPSMGKAKVYGPQGVVQVGGTDVEKDEITYKFVPQAFVNAYVRAYHTEDPVFLVIEEINRGNCAQIFGDMFQLLDRNAETGESDYAIKPDTDLQHYLCSVMGDALTDCEEIQSGEEMRLPSNLYIWATMNTSDQSLFPIDSAFKRRWDWKYIPIADAGKGYQIEVGGRAYDWWDFLEKINAEIGEVTSSEDKMLGYFFAKAKGGKVTADMFVSKVLFYLWNDVFKDFGTDRPLFEKGKNDKDNTVYLSFKDFFKPNGDVNEENVIRLLDNLKVKASQEAEEDDDGNTPSTDASKRNYDKFSVNGEGAYRKNRLAEACVKKYIELHSEKSADEVVTEWKTLGEIVSHFIETEEKFNARTDNAKDRSTRVECNGSALYVAHKGYGADNGKAEVLMNAVNSKDWGITIEKL